MELKNLCLLLLLIFLFSCKNASEKNSSINIISDTTLNETETTITNNTAKLAEFFVDSLTVGRKSYNKFELSYYRTTDSFYTVINFYSNNNNKWILRNEFVLQKDGILGCNVDVSDFNNDGYNDITYISAVASQGANNIMTLLVYDKKTDKLILIKNSQVFPNLQYNKELNCIDAFSVYGGCMSMFLKIEGDSLKPFATVELGNGVTVIEYDDKGNEKIILKDTTNGAKYIRYKSYKPLKEYINY